MPIRFRCTYCNRLLGIATRKAGMETTCPHCGYQITVPVPQADDTKTERLNLDDVEELLGQTGTTTAKESSAVAPVAPVPAKPAPAPLQAPPVKPRPAPPPVPKTAPNSANPDERPLFEADVDALLGSTEAREEPAPPKHVPTTGKDALSLDDSPKQIVLTGPTATLLMILVVVLIAIAFAAGLFLAPKS